MNTPPGPLQGGAAPQGGQQPEAQGQPQQRMSLSEGDKTNIILLSCALGFFGLAMLFAYVLDTPDVPKIRMTYVLGKRKGKFSLS
jgi:hypothetical protein